MNALLLGYLMYRSGLVPRLIPVLGLIGAPLLIASATATLFRSNDPVTVLAAIATAHTLFNSRLSACSAGR